MSDYDNDKELIHTIENCILATKMPRNPRNLVEEIICDADTYHFGTKEFKDTNKRMREEYALRQEKISKEDWDEDTQNRVIKSIRFSGIISSCFILFVAYLTLSSKFFQLDL